ncbi:hypothetical protein ACFRMQ_09825 [Kitasatospora sp. NPDC056783]|uniref:hypothetical protein n=1 Tax=Kitasatospora sp. NPDC056783 TaxID=3345943 RepID=UPI0036AD2057
MQSERTQWAPAVTAWAPERTQWAPAVTAWAPEHTQWAPAVEAAVEADYQLVRIS